MLQIGQAFDRERIPEIPTDDAVTFEAKEAATRARRLPGPRPGSPGGG
jgi:hypothetical protein